MDIGIIIPHIATYGGAAKFAMECIVRWQKKNKLTIYTSAVKESVLSRYTLGSNVRIRMIEPFRHGDDELFVNHVVVPSKWTTQIGVHDVYLSHFFPANLVNRHPSVWYPHEPFRRKRDLRNEENLEPLLSDIPPANDKEFSCDHLNLLQSSSDLFLDSIRDFDPTAVDYIVANSRYTAKQLRRIYGCKVDSVVYPGASKPKFCRPDWDNNMILSLSNTAFHKRIDLILNAMKYVDGAKLVHIGSGAKWEDDYIKKLITIWRLNDKARFIGGADDTTVENYLRKCVCVVYTPLREPFGMVPLEAMARGKPVVCVQEGGYPEIVNKSCAFFVRPYPSEVGSAISRLLNNKGLVHKMGRAGIQIAESYSWDRTAVELMDVLIRAHKKYQRASNPPSPSRLIGLEYNIMPKDRSPVRYTNSGARPLLGHYRSSSGAVIQTHLNWIKQAGVDLLVINLRRPIYSDAYELQVIDRIFRVAETAKSRLLICVCIHAGAELPYSIRSAISTVLDCFSRRRDYLRVAGKPVIFINDSIKGAPRTSRVIAIKLPPAKSGALTFSKHRRISIVRVCPLGADFSKSKGSYTKLMKEAMNQRRRFLIISGFNTFQSGFHIEPTDKNGSELIKLTRKLTSAASAK